LRFSLSLSFPFSFWLRQRPFKKEKRKQTLTTEAMSGGGQQLRESAGGAGGLGDLPCELLTHILSYATPPAATIPLEVDPPPFAELGCCES
jgi:hypothetical protein